LNVDVDLLELRNVRETYARQIGSDIQAIHRDLKTQEQAGGRRDFPRCPQSARANVGGTLPADSNSP
jgi:hypothetical protein